MTQKTSKIHYIVDVDGTVANTLHRNKHLTNTKIPPKLRWRTFFREDHVAEDTRLPNTEILNHILAGDDPVTFLTARPDYLQQTTTEWLKKHFSAFDPNKHGVITKPQNTQNQATPQWKADVINEICPAPASFLFIDDSPENLEHVKYIRPDGAVMYPKDAWGFLEGQRKMQKSGQEAPPPDAPVFVEGHGSVPITVSTVPAQQEDNDDNDEDDDDQDDPVVMEMLGPLDFDEPHDPFDIIEIESPDDGEVQAYDNEREEEDMDEDEDL